jgi:hypothetical protein
MDDNATTVLEASGQSKAVGFVSQNLGENLENLSFLEKSSRKPETWGLTSW